MSEMIDNETKKELKELAKEMYRDGGKQIVSPTGDLVSLVPRAIKAALEPLEQWIMQREYNIAETKKLLEDKLKNIPPEQIQPPDAHIAVPALQYISYCMDNEELRDMYANLLANSMNNVVKNGVHPGFVEIIKQLCPDEAKFLKYMMLSQRVPTIGLKYQHADGSGITIVKDFSLVPKFSGCEHVNDSEKYIDNLVRLGLLQRSEALSSLADKTLYEPLKNAPYIAQHNNIEKAKKRGFEKIDFEESFIDLTAYGKNFCSICLETAKVVSVKIV